MSGKNFGTRAEHLSPHPRGMAGRSWALMSESVEKTTPRPDLRLLCHEPALSNARQAGETRFGSDTQRSSVRLPTFLYQPTTAS
jgi:hypothetical protein